MQLLVVLQTKVASSIRGESNYKNRHNHKTTNNTLYKKYFVMKKKRKSIDNDTPAFYTICLFNSHAIKPKSSRSQFTV
jgi:hypothetical protein